MTSAFQSFRNSVKHWYIPLIIGIVFIIFGIYTLTVPVETYVALSIIFSVSFMVSGFFDIFFSIQNSKILSGWGWYLVSGILSLLIGIYLISYPGISMAVLPFVVGFTLLFRFSLLLGYSFDLKNLKIPNWGMLTFLSILGIILSFLLIANPSVAGLSLVALTATVFILSGISSIALSISLKKLKDAPEKISKDLKDRLDLIEKELDQQASKK